MEKAEQEDAHVLNSYKVTIKIQGGTSMNKGNIIGLGVMAAAAAAVVAVSGPAYEAIQSSRLKAAADGAEITVVNGEAEGFGGPVQAEVTVAGDKIIALSLTGEGETPEIGGAAMSSLTEAITAAQTLEGVDAVSGATITSEAVFSAVKSAMGIETVEAETEPAQEETETEKAEEAEETKAEETKAEETKAAAVEGALTGTAKGFGGEIQAQVVVDESGVITDLLLTGEEETPEIGGTAMEELTSAILEKGTVEGVDAVSGATVTSEGVFAAVKAAVEAEAVEEETKAVAVEGALTGTAKGFGGEIQAQVVVDESGVITDLLLMGDGETPEIGGTAMEELTSAILEKGTVEGVDAVSGATVTSEGVFAAVKAALEQK